MAGHLLLAIVTFVITNIDDLLLLTFYFASGKYGSKAIVTGQYTGITILILVSLTGLVFKNIISEEWIGLLGIFPVMIGIKELWANRDKNDERQEVPPASTTSAKGVWSVALITIANGGDNIGVYTPLFAKTSISYLPFYLGVFLILTGVWCYLGYYLISHERLKLVLAGYGKSLFPFFLIGLGLYIMKDLFLRE
jgi:cadmium resistance protein CadD (predicted permease)